MSVWSSHCLELASLARSSYEVVETLIPFKISLLSHDFGGSPNPKKEVLIRNNKIEMML